MYGKYKRRTAGFRGPGEAPFQSDPVWSSKAVVSPRQRGRLKVARQSVSEWLRRYRRDGEAGLRQAGRAGRKPLLDAAQLERLEALLLEGPEAHGFPTPLWSCPRVARLIGDEFGVRYHEGHVWKILRALGWSPQRPVGKARERNEEAIRGWQRKTWPAIKKKPAKKNVRSSSSTKAD